MKKFYNNIEVEVIAELPNKQVAIKLITWLHHDYDPEYGDMSEPIENTLVVNEYELRESAVTKDDIILDKITIPVAFLSPNNAIASFVAFCRFLKHTMFP